MTQNHFIIAGAQRSGTTYLYRILDDHPDICMAKPMRPEPKYFLQNFDTLNYDEYISRFFKHCRSGQIFGEKSTSYYENEICAKNISVFLNESKVIFLLRDPVERALSNYFFTLEHGLETRTLEEVFLEKKPVPTIERSTISVDPFDYIGRGRYVDAIMVYQQYFSHENIGVFFFEELISSPEALRALYAFLDVDRTYRSKFFGQVFNAAPKVSRIEHSVYDKLSEIYKKPNQALSQLLARKLPW